MSPASPIASWLAAVGPSPQSVDHLPVVHFSTTGLRTSEKVGGGGSGHVDFHVPGWAWLAFLGFVLIVLLVDLLVVHREPKELSFQRSLTETVVYVGIGLTFGLVILVGLGGRAAGEYLSGYLVEKSLSIDNVFVWALIMANFGVARRYQHRVLFWGIFGAIVMRAVFIFSGVALINRLSWIIYLFGGFLIYTAWRLLSEETEEIDPSDSRVLRWFRRVVPTTETTDGHHLVVRSGGRWMATPLLAVLVVVEVSDLLFAVDSVPAVLGVSRDRFIIFSSNLLAILGLRSLYFLVADLHGRFRFLNEGLAVILAFVGAKMLLAEGVGGLHWEAPTWLSLAVIIAILTTAITASMLKPENDASG